MFGKHRPKEPRTASTHIKLISDTAVRLLAATEPKEIRQIVGDSVHAIADAKVVTVSRYDPATKKVGMGYLTGLGSLRPIAEKRGWIDYTTTTVPISSMTETEYRDFTSGKLRLLEGGIHGLSGRSIPRSVCRTIEVIFGITGVYTIGFTWANTLFGGVSLLMGGGRAPDLVEEIEAIVTLGAVALQRALAERERLRLEDRLLQAQRMEAVGRLAGGVAHDFNNLLTVITGYADLALSNPADQTEVLDALTEISDAAGRATSLTQQLLAFSRRQVIQPEIVDIGEVTTDLQTMLTRLVGEHIDLRFPDAHELFCVLSDRSQLEQVIINLIANARDAMPDGGPVTITLDSVDIADNAEGIEGLEGLDEGSYISLSVCDSGEGIGSEALDHIFEPFFTTKDTGKGTGLGLATAYGIVSQAGGTIVPRSNQERGTTMMVYLPAVECDTVKTADQPAFTASPRGSETILLVEDESAVKRYMTALLERQGYTVIAAESPLNALDQCAAGDGSIDLLITDLVMPTMNGRELSERIKAACPHIKVLFVSGYTEDVVMQQGVQSGSVAFVQKPFDAAVFVDRVRSILDGVESKPPVTGS
jgi:signal transduction histidine kinase/ActR/RegA family two-component response regulator